MEHHRNKPFPYDGVKKAHKPDPYINNCSKFLSTNPLNLNLSGYIFGRRYE